MRKIGRDFLRAQHFRGQSERLFKQEPRAPCNLITIGCLFTNRDDRLGQAVSPAAARNL